MEPSFMKTRKDEFSFTLLFMTIACGVAAGNLMSNWVTAKFIEHQAKSASIEVSKELQRQARAFEEASRQSKEHSAAQDAARQEALRQQRATDPTGQKLARACAEWQKADSDLKSYTTQTEAKKHCSRYDKYLSDGRF